MRNRQRIHCSGERCRRSDTSGNVRNVGECDWNVGECDQSITPNSFTHSPFTHSPIHPNGWIFLCFADTIYLA
jgi:hypothetical protein